VGGWNAAPAAPEAERGKEKWDWRARRKCRKMADMSDEAKPGGQTAEQWAEFQKIWGETFSKLMQLGVTFSPDSAPPEILRQMRSGIFQALAQSWDQFLRSPQFMEGMKQWMDSAIAFRKLSNDFFTKVRHETQAPSRDDIDSVMLAVRHMESRVLDRVEELAAQVEDMKQRLGGAGQGTVGGPRRRPPSAGRGRKARRK
jgi:hypothetical protein